MIVMPVEMNFVVNIKDRKMHFVMNIAEIEVEICQLDLYHITYILNTKKLARYSRRSTSGCSETIEGSSTPEDVNVVIEDV
ncbi:hypothetical protein E4T56_gene12145 [Termitomyces sp. T112]|nr:hypothetical protein E4T56_gene12145 [Termitomyces sp. T112]